MKKLNELYEKMEDDILIKDIKINSKQVNNKDLFVCTKGITMDRHDFIDEAIENGASAVVVSREGIKKSVPVIQVENTNQELPQLCRKFYNYPEQKLKIVGITGTEGKTTTALMLQTLLGNDICGYIGTNGRSWKNIVKQDNPNTTPDAPVLYRFLSDFVEDSCKWTSMEISSEALLHKRCAGLALDYAILTNISEDHLNIHKTRENYIAAKKKIFSLLKENGKALVNRDDGSYKELEDIMTDNFYSYGTSKDSDFVIQNVVYKQNKVTFEIQYANKVYPVESPYLGLYNVYNLTCAVAILLLEGIAYSEIETKFLDLKPILGRGEYLDFGQNYSIILDYAHTTNGIKNVLKAVKETKYKRIITITGSAGGREKEKRPLMGQLVLDESDLVVFTMDDPRWESVDSIIDDLIGSSTKTNYIRILAREEAIIYALEEATENDLVLILGKGRDNYMAIGDEKIAYCDYDIVLNYFK